MARTVLVVEDNRDVRESIADYLRVLGWSVMTAEHGQRALEILPEIVDRTFLVLLDLSMPVMDGVSFRKRQLADPSLAHVPVVIVSGEANISTIAAELDAAGHLKKPFDFDELESTVERLSPRAATLA